MLQLRPGECLPSLLENLGFHGQSQEIINLVHHDFQFSSWPRLGRYLRLFLPASAPPVALVAARAPSSLPRGPAALFLLYCITTNLLPCPHPTACPLIQRAGPMSYSTSSPSYGAHADFDSPMFVPSPFQRPPAPPLPHSPSPFFPSPSLPALRHRCRSLPPTLHPLFIRIPRPFHNFPRILLPLFSTPQLSRLTFLLGASALPSAIPKPRPMLLAKLPMQQTTNALVAAIDRTKNNAGGMDRGFRF